MTTRLLPAAAVLGLMLHATLARAQVEPRDSSITIGIVVDGPWDRNDQFLSLFQSEITTLLEREFAPEFPERAQLDGGWTMDGVSGALDRLLADETVDLILAIGLLASADAGRRADLPKPVIAPFVFDPQLQGLPLTNEGASGAPNLNYLAHPAALAEQVRVLREVADFDGRLALLVSEPYVRYAPELWNRVRSAVAEMGISTVIVPVGSSADSALATIPADAEAVHVGALTKLSSTEFDRLVEGLVERGLPSFAFMGVEEVRRGLLVGLYPETFWLRIARRVALNVQRILLGEEAGTLPVAIAYGEQLTINITTARAIGVSPPWSVITEAELITAPESEVGRQLTLASAVQEAAVTNRDLAAADRAVAAGAQTVRRARSRLLPQLQVAGLATLIDADRAEASVGSQPQRTLLGEAALTQLVFSEPAWADVAIQGRLQQSREADRAQVELDVVLEAASAYLDVLRATTFERIQRENTRLTRSNLERARVRRVVGVSGPGETLRWESQIASNHRASIAANAQRNLAEIQLNRVLHRPLEERVLTEETGIDAPELLTGDHRLLAYFANQRIFRVFREFMVHETLRNSPELRSLDAAIGAQARAFRSATNQFWAPTVALQGAVSNRFAQGGAGTDFAPQLPPGTPDLSGLFPQANDVNLTLGLRISLPILEGGSRFAARAEAGERLAELRAGREALSERLEQRVRVAAHLAGASFAGIQLARDAATAARRNLDLVSDAYARGVVSIIDVLDAQNAALVADLVAANAVYDFLLDFMQLERASGQFGFFMSAVERDALFEQLASFAADQGISR